MEKYLKMSDVFFATVEPKQLSGWKHQGLYVELKKIQEAAAHAINSHDELVAMNKELIEVIERIIRSSEEFNKIMGASDWADGYKQCAIDTGESLCAIIDNIKAKAAS